MWIGDLAVSLQWEGGNGVARERLNLVLDSSEACCWRLWPWNRRFRQPGSPRLAEELVPGDNPGFDYPGFDGTDCCPDAAYILHAGRGLVESRQASARRQQSGQRMNGAERRMQRRARRELALDDE